MTSAELKAATKDVPIIVGVDTSSENAAIGSMVKWLATNDKAVKILDLFTNRNGVHVSLHYHQSGDTNAYDGNTLIEALASATSAAGKGEQP